MRTVFKDTKVLEQLNKNYAAKLETGEQAAYCDMLLVFDLRKQLYKTLKLKITASMNFIRFSPLLILVMLIIFQ